MANIINLTPHAVRIFLDAEILEVPPSGLVARCSVARHEVDTITVNGVTVPVTETVFFGEVTDLPPETPDTYFIVSGKIAITLPDRRDLLIPDDLVRDSDGRTMGCRALARSKKMATASYI